jgi:hypothetical protein
MADLAAFRLCTNVLASGTKLLSVLAIAMTIAMAIAMTTDIVIGAGSPALKDSRCRMESVSPIEALTIASSAAIGI